MGTEVSELTVTEFVTARLDEDEERARSAVSALSDLDHWAAAASDVIAARRFEVGAHVAQWGPARVLAQCAAMRKIVELRESVQQQVSRAGKDPSDPFVLAFRAQVIAYDAALRTLASIWSDHPQFNPAWA